jgi:uncharacterized protein
MRGLVLLTCLSISALLPLSACTGAPSPSQSTPQSAALSVAPSRSGAVTFSAADGGTITGHVYGSGPTAVILSNMGDNNPQPWESFAPALAARGYTVLTYRYREPLRTAADDLLAAIGYLKSSKGSTRLALVGASLGGMATAKVGGAAGAAAVVLMACPMTIDGYAFRITEAELAALTGPKLVIVSDGDSIVPPAKTRAIYDQVPGPKDFQSFSGTAHGVQLFATDQREAVQKRLVDFLAAHAAP